MLWTVVEWSLALFLASLCALGVLSFIQIALQIIKDMRND